MRVGPILGAVALAALIGGSPAPAEAQHCRRVTVVYEATPAYTYVEPVYSYPVAYSYTYVQPATPVVVAYPATRVYVAPAPVYTPHYHTYGYSPAADYYGAYEVGAGPHAAGYSGHARGVHHGYHHSPGHGWHGGTHYGRY